MKTLQDILMLADKLAKENGTVLIYNGPTGSSLYDFLGVHLGFGNTYVGFNAPINPEWGCSSDDFFEQFKNQIEWYLKENPRKMKYLEEETS